MHVIKLPDQLQELLRRDGSDLAGPVEVYAANVAKILTDNKTTFFPNYTDHGSSHIQNVLKCCVRLVPEGTWAERDSGRPGLSSADAALIICSVLIHDLGMHLTDSGFKELISPNCRFKPVDWLQGKETRIEEMSWSELWLCYLAEMSRAGAVHMRRIVGTEWHFKEFPKDSSEWNEKHRLLIGEFVRRHHARLAHEIALYGFPGVDEKVFPAIDGMGTLSRYADLIGFSARSHGLPFRVCHDALDKAPWGHGNAKRPLGTYALFSMALLRVADYLQIDDSRAPAILFHLRNPEVQISIEEWGKHRAVTTVDLDTAERRAMITVDRNLPLPTFLQLRELFENVQSEIDVSTAVLDEVYGASRTADFEIGLSIRRVTSNLQSPAFERSLPYVPRRSSFTADPSLVSLLVEPLYGRQPTVGVRELIQNAVDAVRELREWRKHNHSGEAEVELEVSGADVLVDFVKSAEGKWLLRVTDRGIGMKASTISDYFLRAGASFRRSPEWIEQFHSESGTPTVLRSGRFGIGALATFLLGESFKLRTRHAASGSDGGFAIEATAGDDLIEIRRASDLPIGTCIEVRLSLNAVESLGLEGVPTLAAKTTDWYCWDNPRVVRRVLKPHETDALEQKKLIPQGEPPVGSGWMTFSFPGYERINWSLSELPRIVCNGIRVASPSDNSLRDSKQLGWPTISPMKAPGISVEDAEGSFPLTLQRYEQSSDKLPFTERLMEEVWLIPAHR